VRDSPLKLRKVRISGIASTVLWSGSNSGGVAEREVMKRKERDRDSNKAINMD
jgi:hypothetical protein